MTRRSPHPELLEPAQTARLLLRPLGVIEAYRLSVRHVLNDPEMLRAVKFHTKGRSAFRWFFSMERPNRRTKFTHAIHERETGKLIGLHSIRLFPYRSATMAVTIHDRMWWGRAVVTEARDELIGRVFASPGVDRIAAEVIVRNIPSVFNYRKLGFAHTGTKRRAILDPVRREPTDLMQFELLRDDWEMRERP